MIAYVSVAPVAIKTFVFICILANIGLTIATSSTRLRPQINLTEDNFTSVFPIVCTYSGCVEGIAKTGFQIDEFEAFFGIPYAEPPVGDLRFAVSFWLNIIVFILTQSIKIKRKETRDKNGKRKKKEDTQRQ